MAAQGPREADVQARVCAGMQIEMVLGDMGRADCVSATHAIEVEWAEKWHEGIGQVLAYATATGKRPGLVLICRPEQDAGSCLRYSLSAREVFSAQGIGATVWECAADATQLSDCLRRETDKP